MKYLLDTNVCIALLNGRHPQVAQRFARCRYSDVSVCAIVLGELEYGAYKSDRIEHNLSLLHKFASPLICLPFDAACASHYGQIHAQLKQQGQVIGNNDMLIAAIARSNGLILVTNNEREFLRVPSLQLENWHTTNPD